MMLRENKLVGRYITHKMILPILEQYQYENIIFLGNSVQGKAINLYQIGKGSKKILMWSQMHGNESTTTKALLDALKEITNVKKHLLQNVSIYFIPMLNPDGAEVYTRVNANEIDLNRDAFDLSQPESQYLKKAYELIKPDFCFNLHDQRTIFSAGKANYPATISFLAPSFNEEREINNVRKKAMEIISAMNRMLQKCIPNQVGRFDDSFNINCTGDMFTFLKTPTILFEAGHYPNDYNREETRKYIALSIIEAIDYICDNYITGDNHKAYFEIPENDKLFFDILLRDDFYENTIDIGILFKEHLQGQEIIFIPYIAETGNLQKYYGHREYQLSDFFTTKPEKECIMQLLDLEHFSI